MINPDRKPKTIGHRLIGEAESFYKTHIHTEKRSKQRHTNSKAKFEPTTLLTLDRALY